MIETLTDDLACPKDSDQLQLENATYAAIVDSSDDAMISQSLQGIVITWNAAAERIFGYQADEMIGDSILRLVPADRVAEENSFLTRLARGQKVDQLKTIRLTKSGREIHVLVTSSPIRDSAGRIVGACTILRDTTGEEESKSALRNQQIHLEHLSRLNSMGEMAAGLAHELNQPLTSILAYAGVSLDLLQSENPSPEKTIPAMKEIVSEARRAAEMIRRIREFIRKKVPRRELMDINARIVDSVQLMNHDLVLAEITVRLQLDENLPRVSADPVQFVQVMVNLLRNARDAMLDANAEARELCIRSSCDDQHVHVQVIDRGCGVTDDQLVRLFECFYSTKSSGLGMGLAISKTMIESLGGHLTAVNCSDGGGMTFSISLPVASQRLQ